MVYVIVQKNVPIVHTLTKYLSSKYVCICGFIIVRIYLSQYRKLQKKNTIMPTKRGGGGNIKLLYIEMT